MFERCTLRRGRLLAAGAAGAALPLLAAGCGPGVESPAAAKQAPPPRAVGVAAPVQGDVVRTLSQPGTMQGIEEATLYARASGYLKSIYVDKGDPVRTGQVLAVIESPELRHEVDQARSTYDQARTATLGTVASK